jgi:hypothetical protein
MPNGHAVITFGVDALGPEAVVRIIKTIAVYEDFCRANIHTKSTVVLNFEKDDPAVSFERAEIDGSGE